MTSARYAEMFCVYCCEPFTPARSNQVTCSKPCQVRTSTWDRWLRETREAAIRGRTGPALPAGGASLAAAVSCYAVQFELEEVAV